MHYFSLSEITCSAIPQAGRIAHFVKQLLATYRSKTEKTNARMWPLVMFHHQTTVAKQAPIVVHLTENSFERRPLCRVVWYSTPRSLVISQLMSSPCYLSPQIHGSGDAACCCCHILICSPLWKTLALLNFTFMVFTHNKWGGGERHCCFPAASGRVHISKNYFTSCSF